MAVNDLVSLQGVVIRDNIGLVVLVAVVLMVTLQQPEQ
jgi:hypothetical protein